jgi:hypothetical protein
MIAVLAKPARLTSEQHCGVAGMQPHAAGATPVHPIRRRWIHPAIPTLRSGDAIQVLVMCSI